MDGIHAGEANPPAFIMYFCLNEDETDEADKSKEVKGLYVLSFFLFLIIPS
jgi:hypothetical protein